jgi:hypothetical protein
MLQELHSVNITENGIFQYINRSVICNKDVKEYQQNGTVLPPKPSSNFPRSDHLLELHTSDWARNVAPHRMTHFQLFNVQVIQM